jgi:hypothetical protein
MFPTELKARSTTLGDEVYVGDRAVDAEFKLVTIEDEETTYTITLDKTSAKFEHEDGHGTSTTTVPEGSFALEITPQSGVLTNVGNTTTITVSFPPAPQNFIGSLQLQLIVENSLDGSRQILLVTSKVGALAHPRPRGTYCTLAMFTWTKAQPCTDVRLHGCKAVVSSALTQQNQLFEEAR